MVATKGATRVGRVGKLEDQHRVDIFLHRRMKDDTFELRWRKDGVRDQQGSFSDMGTAEAAARVVHEYLKKGLDLPYGKAVRQVRREAPAPERVQSLASLADEWLAQHGGKIGTREDHRSILKNHVLAAAQIYDEDDRPTINFIDLNSIAPADLTRTHVQTWKKSLAFKPNSRRPGTTLSSSTVKTALVTLRALLSWAVVEGKIEKNVAAQVKHTVYGSRKPAWFKDEAEFWSFVNHCPEWSRVIFITMIYTGARFGEIAGLQVGDIDFGLGRVRFSRSVDKRGRLGTVKTPSSEDYVDLHPVAREWLERHIKEKQLRPGERLFSGPRLGRPLYNTVLRTAMVKGLEAAGLDKAITIHGTRHSTATWLRKAGLDTRVIQRILRHADPRTTAVYLHEEEAEIREGIRLLRGE
jgi:integrase